MSSIQLLGINPNIEHPSSEFERWAREACRAVGLKKYYPFETLECVTHRDQGIGGYAVPRAYGGAVVCIAYESLSLKHFLEIYLHEVGHVVASQTSIDTDPSGGSHNKYFATVTALMYRRVGIFDRITIYDFADGHHYQNGHDDGGLGRDDEKMVDGEALIERFSYIVTYSAMFARTTVSVEAAARWMYEKHVLPEWLPKKPVSPWWKFWN